MYNMTRGPKAYRPSAHSEECATPSFLLIIAVCTSVHYPIKTVRLPHVSSASKNDISSIQLLFLNYFLSTPLKIIYDAEMACATESLMDNSSLERHSTSSPEIVQKGLLRKGNLRNPELGFC